METSGEEVRARTRNAILFYGLFIYSAVSSQATQRTTL
jgi:hypothetical protein